jgi:hypothetical protein
VSASHGGFSVLKSLPSLLVLNWVLKVRVCSVLVEDCILQILFLFICQSIHIDVASDISIIERTVLLLVPDLFDLIGKFDAVGRVGGSLCSLDVRLGGVKGS